MLTWAMPHAAPTMQRMRNPLLLLRAAFIPLAALMLQGCGVTSVVGAAAGAAISVTGAVVSTGVSLTGKAVGAGIDAVTPSSDKK